MFFFCANQIFRENTLFSTISKRARIFPNRPFLLSFRKVGWKAGFSWRQMRSKFFGTAVKVMAILAAKSKLTCEAINFFLKKWFVEPRARHLSDWDNSPSRRCEISFNHRIELNSNLVSDTRHFSNEFYFVPYQVSSNQFWLSKWQNVQNWINPCQLKKSKIAF